jgi:hypothetical protein
LNLRHFRFCSHQKIQTLVIPKIKFIYFFEKRKERNVRIKIQSTKIHFLNLNYHHYFHYLQKCHSSSVFEQNRSSQSYQMTQNTKQNKSNQNSENFDIIWISFFHYLRRRCRECGAGRRRRRRPKRRRRGAWRPLEGWPSSVGAAAWRGPH